ncbi:hypothetical protein HOE31_01195 [bacterium]|jgi:hypothetical protein|nr:hypothetical protein [bacterium]MBT4121548.1 hypothetical protein [bacterium]MBT4495193.1 hypothetical protein [bacterium]MBT4763684.1 hypothetical protein [bacterium]MBT5401055.1 hypothetical protein [bacterium]
MFEIAVGNIIEMDIIGDLKVEETYPSNNRVSFSARKQDGSKKLYVFKGFPLKHLEGDDGLTHEEIDLIKMKIDEYQKLLKNAGVSVIEDIGFISRTHGDGSLFQWQYEPFAGKSIEYIIKNYRREVVLRAIKTVWKTIIEPLFNTYSIESNPLELSVGLDLIPRNMTYIKKEGNSSIDITYVDLFPPKITLATGIERKYKHILEHPEPTDRVVRDLAIFRGFNMIGIIIAFWTHLSRIRPELTLDFYKLFKRLIKDFDVEHKGLGLGLEVDEYTLNNDLSIGGKSHDEISEIIDDWKFKDIFRLRMLACAISFHSKADTEKLTKKVFELSHFQTNRLTHEQILEIKKVILEMTNI